MTFPGPFLKDALRRMEETNHLLARELGRPLYLGQPPEGYYRFPTRNSYLIQVLKSVGVTSSLNAAVHLAGIHHYNEANILLRAACDGLLDIMLLDEAHHSPDGAKTYQQAFVEEFFSGDDVERVRSIAKGERDPKGRIPRAKKRAAVERSLGREGTGEVRLRLEATDAALDGFVHFGHAQLMELYSSALDGEGFKMCGVRDPARASIFPGWIALITHRALICGSSMLRDIRRVQEAEELLKFAGRFSESAEYG